MAIDRDAVYTPEQGRTMVIGGETGGKTTHWAFQMTQNGIWLPRGEWMMQLTGRIVAANFATGVDDRVERQRQSIEQMLEHLKVHCPALLGMGDCEHIGRVSAVPSKEIL